MPDTCRHSQTLGELRRRLREMEQSRADRVDRRGGLAPKPAPALTAIDGLDGLLPDSGLQCGTLMEWLVPGDGAAAGTLAFRVAARFLQEIGGPRRSGAPVPGSATRSSTKVPGRRISTGKASGTRKADVVPGCPVLVVVDQRQQFYPAAAVPLGIDLDATIVVRPHSRKDTLWALEQSLRCVGVGAVVGWVDDHLEGVSYRRLQLAAAAGGGIGLLVRPAEMQRQPSWADVRLLVRPLPAAGDSADSPGRRLQITRLSSSRSHDQRDMRVDIDDEGFVRVVSPVAAPAHQKRATGA